MIKALFGLFSVFVGIILVLAALYVVFKIVAEVGEFVFWLCVGAIIFYLSWSFVLYLVGFFASML